MRYCIKCQDRNGLKESEIGICEKCMTEEQRKLGYLIVFNNMDDSMDIISKHATVEEARQECQRLDEEEEDLYTEIIINKKEYANKTYILPYKKTKEDLDAETDLDAEKWENYWRDNRF